LTGWASKHKPSSISLIPNPLLVLWSEIEILVQLGRSKWVLSPDSCPLPRSTTPLVRLSLFLSERLMCKKKLDGKLGRWTDWVTEIRLSATELLRDGMCSRSRDHIVARDCSEGREARRARGPRWRRHGW
jgi:hypothetical protein